MDSEFDLADVTERLPEVTMSRFGSRLDAPYEAGRRGGWLKVNQAHTLDLVVLAAEWGHGRRPRLAEQPPPRRP